MTLVQSPVGGTWDQQRYSPWMGLPGQTEAVREHWAGGSSWHTWLKHGSGFSSILVDILVSLVFHQQQDGSIARLKP